MDTIVSSTNWTGGLLVLVDRKSRRYVIEKLAHVTQDDIVAALKRHKGDNSNENVRTAAKAPWKHPQKIAPYFAVHWIWSSQPKSSPFVTEPFFE